MPNCNYINHPEICPNPAKAFPFPCNNLKKAANSCGEYKKIHSDFTNPELETKRESKKIMTFS